MSFDPAESIRKAKRREELTRQLNELQEEFQAKRQRMLEAILYLVKALLRDPDNPGNPFGPVNPFAPAERQQAVAEALISACRVAKDTGFGAGVAHIIEQDNDRLNEIRRWAIYLWRLADADQQAELVEALRQANQLPLPKDPQAGECVSAAWIAQHVAYLLDNIIPRPWESGAMPGWHPDWQKVNTLQQELADLSSMPLWQQGASGRAEGSGAEQEQGERQAEGGDADLDQQRPKQGGGAVMSNRSNDEPRPDSPPPFDPRSVLDGLLSEAESRRRQEAEARQIEADRARRLGEQQVLRGKLEDAFDFAYLFPREETEEGRKPCPEGFQRWAERFLAIGRILRECDAAGLGLRLVARLRVVVDRPAPAAMRFACALLLLAADEQADAVASALADATGDGELRWFVRWLGFILDNFWVPFAGEDGIIRVTIPDGITREEYAQAGQAFGWRPCGLTAEPPTPPPPDTLETILCRCAVIRDQLAKKAGEGARGVRIDTPDAQLAFLRGELGDVYLLPALEPLWNAAHALNLGDVPPWRGEPQTGPEAFEALAALADWCRLHSAGTGDRDERTEGADAERDHGEKQGEGGAAGRDQGGAGGIGRTDAGEWEWVPDGNGYRVAGLGEQGHFAGLKGLAIIAQLVQAPGQPVPMALLMSSGEQLGNDRRTRQPAMDLPALKAAYSRCSSLRTEIEQHEADGRSLEAHEAREELEQLEKQLLAAVGVKGRVRDLNNLADKLRPTIHGNLTRVYKAMREANPVMPKLAEHLESAISSESAAFVYRPAFKVTWKTTPPAKL
jgi:hypothetical protein